MRNAKLTKTHAQVTCNPQKYNWHAQVVDRVKNQHKHVHKLCATLENTIDIHKLCEKWNRYLKRHVQVTCNQTMQKKFTNCAQSDKSTNRNSYVLCQVANQQKWNIEMEGTNCALNN